MRFLIFINNTKIWHSFLCIDIQFATELLNQHKSAIDQQAVYAIATNTEDDSTTEGSKFVTLNYGMKHRMLYTL